MATLINGNLNSPIYAAQDADLLAAICGNTTCVTPVGEQFAETLEDANTIMVADGVIITKEGRRIQIDAGDIDEFLIPTGTQGQTQYFICGYHLYTDEDSAELCETFVEPVSSASEVITENTFRGGATEVYVSLLRVKQVGVQIDTITRLLPSSTTISQINSDLTVLNRVATAYKRNHLGNSVSLANTDENHQYTFDYDGYVLTKASSGDVYTVLGDSNSIHMEFKTTSGESNLLFVKAGMRYYRSGGTGTLTAVYRPLVDA